MSSYPLLWSYGDKDQPVIDLDSMYIIGRHQEGEIFYYLCKPVYCEICNDLHRDFRVTEAVNPDPNNPHRFPIGEKMAGDSPIIREIRSSVDQNDIEWW